MNAEKLEDALHFDNRFTNELPADHVDDNYVRQVEAACYSRVRQQRWHSPAWSPIPERSLICSTCLKRSAKRRNLPTSLSAIARQRSAQGHQFGNWAGDGRAINLGEIVNGQGERWVLQLKGAGPTPYSRTADGLAVLRSSVREFLCSEAMHHLGVPTTRALSLVTTGEDVVRDMFYDGHPKAEPGAVVCRVAPSFTRFGSFGLFAARREHDVLQRLVDYTIRTDFPTWALRPRKRTCAGMKKLCSAPPSLSRTGCAWASCTA